MKYLKNLCAASVLIAALCSLWGCDKDENTLSEAVLASASALNFEAQGAAEKLITVYADADWVTEVPDWVTVTPASGTGVTDVTISVSDNMRDGAEDNPRKAPVVFKGRTLASRAEVIITQNGDKYRDVKEYKVGELDALANESVVSVPNVTVMAVTTEGFVVTDDQKSGTVYILNKSEVNIGDKISIMGTKSTDTQSLSIVDCDILNVVSTGGTVTYPEAKDITGEIDSYKSKTREFISVSGILNGANIAVEGANFSVNITDAPASMGVAALNGHQVTVTGYFAGLAAPVIKIMATEIEDRGAVKIIYYSEDFEWLDPWAEAGGVGKTVETDDLDAKATALTSLNVVVDGTPVTAFDAIEARGYKLIYDKDDNKRIYLQRNYLKFGKTGNHAGIILPPMTEVPEKTDVKLSFDWCGMRQGSGKIDPVNLIVIVENGENKAQFDIPELGWEDGHKLEWVRAEVDLTGVPVDKDTKITITQTQWDVSTANRWFLDNIELIKAK